MPSYRYFFLGQGDAQMVAGDEAGGGGDGAVK
jgi:hypothetical protein